MGFFIDNIREGSLGGSMKTYKSFMKVFAVAVFLLTFFAFSALAVIPRTINYQGYLTDVDGIPIDGPVNITFSIYDIDTGGSPLWSSTRTVDVANGVYSVILGASNSLHLPFDVQYWLGIEIESDGEMTPRQQLSSVGQAIRSEISDISLDADKLDGLDSTAFSSSSHGHDFSDMAGTLQENQLSGSYDGALELNNLTNATMTSATITGSANLTSATITGGTFIFGNFSGTGTGLTDLDANKLSSGTVPPDRLTGTYAIDISGNAGTAAISNDSYMIEGNTLADLDDRYLAPAQIPRMNTITTVDSIGSVGQYSSITIGMDGLPVISYFEISSSNLKVAKCGNAACSSGNIITTVDTSAVVGQYSSIAIGMDGMPVISYHDATNGDLKVVKCGNAHCSSGNKISKIDSVDVEGMFTSITIGIDGLPIISYYASTARDLKVAKCGDSSCSSGNLINTVDSTGFVGEHTSIAIGADGLPIISYYDASNRDLKVAKCGNIVCNFGNMITTIDSAGFVGEYASITIGYDGLPIISYYDASNRDFKLAKCGDSSCSSGNTVTTLDSVGYVGKYTSITIGTNGLPVISYYDASNQNLKVARCGNPSCSAGNTINTTDSEGSVGSYTSMTIGTDGLSVFSYFDAKNEDLKVAKCANAFCLNNWIRR
jgi:hypothetical protein